MNIVKKLVRKCCRSFSSVVFPSSVKVLFLKIAGVDIGKNVALNDGITLACNVGYEQNLSIEDRVAIGPNTIFVITSDPNHSNLCKIKDISSLIKIGKIKVKHDSWIGAGCIILPDVTIGEFSIVGAGSVVTKDVPPFTIVAGAPSKVLRTISQKDMGELK
ncbi:MAG: galactoside o-acetyltransferase [Clostridia bacterium]|jgi:acetyltransferase-like isoleucine patch superfamily enzyme|nr:galactoside o-acetyltransferase [Clostridia bacterium]